MPYFGIPSSTLASSAYNLSFVSSSLRFLGECRLINEIFLYFPLNRSLHILSDTGSYSTTAYFTYFLTGNQIPKNFLTLPPLKNIYFSNTLILLSFCFISCTQYMSTLYSSRTRSRVLNAPHLLVRFTFNVAIDSLSALIFHFMYHSVCLVLPFEPSTPLSIIFLDHILVRPAPLSPHSIENFFYSLVCCCRSSLPPSLHSYTELLFS